MLLLRPDVSLYLLAALQTLPLVAILAGFTWKLTSALTGT